MARQKVVENEPPKSDYEKLREERIRRNQAYLDSLGLGKTKEKMIHMTKTSPKTKKRSLPNSQIVTPGSERRSKRIRKSVNTFTKAGKADEHLVMLSYAEKDDRTLNTVKQTFGRGGDASKVLNFIDDEEKHYPVQPRNRRTVKLSADVSNFVLTAEEKKKLSKNRMDQDYLSKFREFLVYHDKISDQNERNVMRQVTKLARGEGIRYESKQYGWPPNCCFMKGTPVTPLSDIVELMEHAADAENRWGRDRGNGWLLSHPLKKLLLFQQFCLKNPDFLTSKCRIQEYYESE